MSKERSVPSHKEKVRLAIATLAFAMMSPSCIVDEILDPPRKPAMTPTPDPTPEVQQNEATAQEAVLSRNLWLRRVALDLLGRFPSQEERKQAAQSEAMLAVIIDQWLQSPRAAVHLARTMEESLGIYSTKNLDQSGLAEGQPWTGAIFAEGAEYFLRFFLERALSGKASVNELISGKYIIESPEALDYLSFAASYAPFAGDRVQLALLPDQVPSLGLLNVPAFIFSQHHSFSGVPYRSSYQMWKKLVCAELESSDAHTFANLATTSAEVLRGATANQPCSSCHSQYSPIAELRTDTESGSSIEQWISGSSPPEHSELYYSGHRFDNLLSFEEGFRTDPRLARCFVNQLISMFFQTTNLTDSQTAAESLALMHLRQNDRGLRGALKAVFLSKPYGNGRNDLRNQPSTTANNPGLRFLQRHHLLSIAEALVKKKAAFEIPPTLRPTFHGIDSGQIYYPDASFFAGIRHYALRLAYAIVSSELVTGRSAESRTVLTRLPDGTGLTDDPALINLQILDVWSLLTSRELDPASETFTKLRDIFDTAVAQQSDSDFISADAWQAVLTAVFLSPEFLML